MYYHKSKNILVTWKFLRDILGPNVVSLEDLNNYYKNTKYLNFDVELYGADNNIKDLGTSNNVICHYTKYNTACIILESNKLKYSRLSNQSDPKELIEILFPFISWSVGEIDEPEKKWDNLNTSAYKKLSKEVQIICFSSNTQLVKSVDYSMVKYYLEKFATKNITKQILNSVNYSPAFDKQRMWDNYADKYKGICLVFDKVKICNESKVKGINDFVNYVNKFDGTLADISKTVDENIERNLHYLFQKHIDYKDESEFRMLIISDKEEYINIKSSLKAVIIGDRVPDKDLVHKKLKNLRESLNLEFKIFKHNAIGLLTKGYFIELDNNDIIN